MNQIIEKYRAWRVEHVDYGYMAHYSLKRAFTKEEFIRRFKIEKSAKVTPLFDWRMKHGGKTIEMP